MTSSKHLRGIWKAPTLLIGLALFLGACATTPTRPPLPPSSGDPRVEPQPTQPDKPDIDVPDVDPNAPDPNGAQPNSPETIQGDDGGLTPRFMADREIKRAAVLLPFSHPNSNVRNEAAGMLAAIEMALFDHAEEDFLLLPKDTGGLVSQAEEKADMAIAEGADLILGPLFADNVKAVRNKVSREGVPVVAFSNDRSAAGYGAYLASITPEDEVARVMDYAAANGVRSFAFLGPDNDYGRRIETAMRYRASRVGGRMISSAFYDPSNVSPVAESKEVAAAIKGTGQMRSGRVAVMVPERGTKLRQVAPLLPYNGVDLRYVKLLGTGQWNDPSIWREPTLVGGIFAAPDPENFTQFNETYNRLYGRKPSGLASLSYDAASMAISLAEEDRLNNGAVTDSDGFMGLNGLFRFRVDGTTERGLAVMQIQDSVGAVIVEPGKEEFGIGGS